MTTLRSVYKKWFGFEANASDTSTDEEAAAPKNSLMHLSYQRKVSTGLIPAGQTCDNCICFGDEWPL